MLTVLTRLGFKHPWVRHKLLKNHNLKGELVQRVYGLVKLALSLHYGYLQGTGATASIDSNTYGWGGFHRWGTNLAYWENPHINDGMLNWSSLWRPKSRDLLKDCFLLPFCAGSYNEIVERDSMQVYLVSFWCHCYWHCFMYTILEVTLC